MKTLMIDEQTISDLGIFASNHIPGVFDLYNQVCTRGGEVLLKACFKNPLACHQEINRRSSIMQHFSQQDIRFPFDPAMLDMTEKYLAPVNGREGHQTLSEKEIQHGVTCIITLMQSLYNFINREDIKLLQAYQQERQPIADLLSDPAFEAVLTERNQEKLAFSAVTAYDTLFRLQESSRVQILMQHLYMLDVYTAMAQLALSRKFTFAAALENQGAAILHLEKVYHPELNNPVDNTILMDDKKNVIFLTGANMAGKSTFLRAMSTAVYIAHIGFPVAAQGMRFTVFDGLYTTINLPDNLGIGASHFYNEVLRVKKVAGELHLGKSLYVVFDELFRGTNVKDAEEGTVALTTAFARKKNSIFLISSHIIEAGQSLDQISNIGFQYLPTQMNGHQPVYTYKLKEGITDDRHGMIIIRNEGILEILAKGLR